jgi:hypothetical protein
MFECLTIISNLEKGLYGLLYGSLPHSCGVRSPFSSLHDLQAQTMFENS